MNIRDYLLLGIDSSEEKMITANHDDKVKKLLEEANT